MKMIIRINMTERMMAKNPQWSWSDEGSWSRSYWYSKCWSRDYAFSDFMDGPTTTTYQYTYNEDDFEN